MSLTLDQVRCFVAVAEELHFGRAAERLSMTQPPLSRQIQKLERAVGATLLERDNRRVELTGAGAAFLDEAYRMLNLVDSAGDLARRVDAGTAGVVRLGFTAVSAISVLGPLLRRLTAALPDVEVLLSERVTNAQVDGIRRAELDIGLARPPFDTGFLASQVVRREPLIAVVPVDHPLASVVAAADAVGLRGAAGHRLPPAAVALLPRAAGAVPHQRPPEGRAAGPPGADRDAAGGGGPGPGGGAGLCRVAPRRGRGPPGPRPRWWRHPAGRRPRTARRAPRHLAARLRHPRRTTGAERDRRGGRRAADQPGRPTSAC